MTLDVDISEEDSRLLNLKDRSEAKKRSEAENLKKAAAATPQCEYVYTAKDLANRASRGLDTRLKKCRRNAVKIDKYCFAHSEIYRREKLAEGATKRRQEALARQLAEGIANLTHPDPDGTKRHNTAAVAGIVDRRRDKTTDWHNKKYRKLPAGQTSRLDAKRKHIDQLNLRDELAVLQMELEDLLRAPTGRCSECKRHKDSKDIIELTDAIRRTIKAIHDMENSRQKVLTSDYVHIMLLRIVREIIPLIPNTEDRKKLAMRIKTLSKPQPGQMAQISYALDPAGEVMGEEKVG